MYFYGSDDDAVSNTERPRVKGTLWDKPVVAYFEFSSVTAISTSRLRTKIRTRDLPNTKQAHQSLTRDARSYIHWKSRNLHHHHTGSLLLSLQLSLYRLPVCITYAAWCVERHSTRIGTELLVWTPASGPGIYIISLSKSRTTRTRKTLISVQRPQMRSAVNIKMMVTATESAYN